mmetsp:Transcript_11554/g.13131  ORF Transcript_11554/g.13131 Transcript_11554/m.13131 type:complete len:85 (+) Transcript_11554:257-511(+)
MSTDDNIVFPIVRQNAFISGSGGGKFTVSGPDNDEHNIFVRTNSEPIMNRFGVVKPSGILWVSRLTSSTLTIPSIITEVSTSFK